MPRVALKVNIILLKREFEAEDQPGRHANQNKLWDAVATNYNKGKDTAHPTITGGVARLRVLENGWPIRTEKGKKGRSDIHLDRPKAGTRRKKSDKFKDDPTIKAAFDAQRQHTPKKFHPLIVLAENGSRAASDKLNCLECSNWQPQEVRLCTVNHCAKYPFRPYQGKAGETEVENEEAGELAEAA